MSPCHLRPYLTKFHFWSPELQTLKELPFAIGSEENANKWVGLIKGTEEVEATTASYFAPVNLPVNHLYSN